MAGDSVTFWELPQFIVAVSPKSGSTSFARAYPDAVRLEPRKDAERFKSKGCVYHMRNPLSRVVSAYKGFATVNKNTKHSPPSSVMEKGFPAFVGYATTHSNHYWDPVYPFMDFITEIRPFSRFPELVGEKQENKSDKLSVFIDHETFALIASHWCRDFLIYNTIYSTGGNNNVT